MKQTTGASVVGENTFISAVWETAILLFINGSSLPSADPNKRAVPMDLFPTNLLDNIVTTDLPPINRAILQG